MTSPVETTEYRVEKLDNDYATWAVLFQASLEDKELWEAIADPQPNADTDPTAAATWAKKDRRAFGRLKMSVALHHLPTVQACTTAREAWDALASVFTAKMNARRLQLTQEFALLKIKPGEDLLAYSGRAKKLQLEMAATGHPYDDNTVLIHFLSGLGDEYKMEKKMLTNRSTAMQWDEVMPMLYPVENENKTDAALTEGPSVGAYIARRDGKWPRDTPMPKEERRRRVVCWTCGMRGHNQRECTKGGSDRPGIRGGPSAAFMAVDKPAIGTRLPYTDKEVVGGVSDADPAHPAARAAVSASVVGTSAATPSGTTWMIDSGATNHMHTRRVGFNAYDPIASTVTIANGHSVPSPGHRSVNLSTSLGGTMSLGHALYVPHITANLLSVRAMAKRGKVTFEGDTVTIEQNGRIVGKERVDSIEQYIFKGNTTETVALSAQQLATKVDAAVAYGRAGDVGHLWHRRLGHLGLANVLKVAKLVTGMTLKSSEVAATEGAPCVPCVQARLVHSPHGDDSSDTTKLQKLHVDVVGPLDPSEGGVVHFMSALDDCTEMGFATPIKTKAEAGPALRVWVTHLEKQTGLKVKIIRCDGAGELVGSASMVKFFNDTGIKAETTPPYNPQMNGKAERLNRTIMERLRAVLLEYKLPKSLWAELLMALFFLRNRSPTADGSATPYERFYGKKPDVSHLRVLGSPAYALKPAKTYNKLEAKTLLGTIVGYAAGGHALSIKSATTGHILIRRDVTADETVPATPVHLSALPVSLFLPDGWSVDTPTAIACGDDGGDRDVPDTITADDTNVPTGPPVPPAPAGHGYNLRHHGASAMAVKAPPSPAALVPMTVPAAVSRPDWCATPPKTRAEALARPDAYLWQQAMDDEMASLRAAHAWVLLDLPASATVTGGRWVFDYKRDAIGTVSRCKARYVAQGYTQRAGVDYNDVWAPCPARATVRAVMALVAANDLKLHVIDIKTAYLNAPMDVDVYVQQPEGYEEGPAGTVARLLHALSGCKQAGRLWGNHCHGTLTAIGAARSTADPTMYVWQHPFHGPIIILVHVDDMAITAKTLAGVTTAKEVVLSAYKGRDLGASDTFLGMRVDRDRTAGTLTLSCPGVTTALLEQSGMDAARPNKLPMPAKTTLTRTGEQPLANSTRYSELVGSILYLSTTTRPDIAYAAGLLARYMNDPEEQHWTAAKGVLRYLAATADWGLRYGATEGLVGAVDADLGGCPETRRSTTGWVFT